jgi:hypothetical protein
LSKSEKNLKTKKVIYKLSPRFPRYTFLSSFAYSTTQIFSKMASIAPVPAQSSPAVAASLMSAVPVTAFTILFHGNCIDGWFSAYIAHTALKSIGPINMFPISPSQTNTWPRAKEMAGTNILLLDVSVAEHYRKGWMEAGAVSVNCIDHHASGVEHWPAGACPINTASCAAVQTWQHFNPGVEVPFWLHHIDRIDRWDNPTYEDRCIREVLNEIAHKPVQKKLGEAFSLTELFLMNMSSPLGLMMTISQGKTILDKKDAELFAVLNKSGTIHTFTQEYIDGWKLPNSWLGANVFIIDNTNITLDTTEAAHLVFQHYPVISVFINYRKKTLYAKSMMDKGFAGGGSFAAVENKTMYVYSARSRPTFDLTASTCFKGHKTAAGCALIKGEVPVLPFLLTAP